MTEEETHSWSQYRMLIMSKLDEIQKGQNDMKDQIENILGDYSNLRVEVIREAVHSATMRGFWAAAVPAVIAVISMIINLAGKH